MNKIQAEEFLKKYNNKVISKIYDLDPQISTAFLTLDPNFEYPNWSYKPVKDFLANTSIECPKCKGTACDECGWTGTVTGYNIKNKIGKMIRSYDNDCMGNPSSAIIEYNGQQYFAVCNIYESKPWYIIDLGIKVSLKN